MLLPKDQLTAVNVLLLIQLLLIKARPPDTAYIQYNFAEMTDESSTGGNNLTATTASSSRFRDFKQISRMALESLKSHDYVDRPLDEADNDDNPVKHYREHKGRTDSSQLKGHHHHRHKGDLPGRGKAMLIAHSSMLTKQQHCTGELFKQRVRVPGCLSKVVVNRFCHGQCASFYIPKLKAKKLKAAFQSCAACVPSDSDRVQVRLHCPTRTPPHTMRTVVKVKKCACRNIDLR